MVLGPTEPRQQAVDQQVNKPLHENQLEQMLSIPLFYLCSYIQIWNDYFLFPVTDY